MKKIFYIILLILLIAISSCSNKKSRIKVISDISLSPISTFEKSCSGCHGYEGADYSENLRDMGDKVLRSEIEGMMFYNAGLSPDSIDVDAMLTYVISLKNNEPFAIILNSKSFLDGKVSDLEIEISPETKMEIRDDNIKVVENRNIQELFYDPAKIKKMEVTVKKNGVFSSFDFPDDLCVQQ